MTLPSGPHPTERFQRVLAFASDEADGLGHGFMTCQHMLYALARESKGLANAVLSALGVKPDTLHELLFESAAVHDRAASLIELSDEVRQAVERAVRVAQEWQHRSLDTEHLLYGILSAPTSADEMLHSLRLDPAVVLVKLDEIRHSAPAIEIRDEATHAYRLSLESAWILSAAADFAHRYEATAISSLHVLLALLSQDTPARSVLLELGLSPEELLRNLGRVNDTISNRGRLPLEEEVQRLLGYAIGEAWNRGHLAVTPLHLAMGLARGERQSVLDLLAEQGVPQSELIEALSTAMPPPTIR